MVLDETRPRTSSTSLSSACPQRKSARVPSRSRRFTVRQTALWRTMAGATPSRPRMPDRLHALRAGSVPPTSLPRIRQRTRSPRIASNEKHSSNFTFISNRRRRRREAEKTAISVSISQESVGINNRRSFNPALIAAHSGIALRRRLLHKSINEYSNTPSLPLRSQRSISTEYSIRANIHLTLSRMPSDTRVLSTSTAFTATFSVDFPCSIAGKALATHFPVPTTEEVLAMSYMCAALFMREERQNRTPNKNLCYHIALLLTN